MTSTVEKLENNQVKLTVTVDAADFDTAVQRAYLKLRSQIVVPGFRRGKAPRKVIENLYGEAVFYEDAFNDICPAAYDAAVEENGLYPVDQPNVDVTQIEVGKDLIFTAEVTVKPEFELGQYKGIEAKRPSYTVEDADVDAEVQRAQDRVARWESVERPAEMGDRVTLDYAGFCEGEQFEGGTAEDQTLELGSGRFIPGFEDQLVGLEVGVESEIQVTFPEEYDERLAGKPATFKVTLKDIKKKEVPELDDEFAKDVSEFDTLEEYKADIRSRLEKDAKDRAENEWQGILLDKVVENTPIDIPDAMVETQLNYMMQELGYQLSYQGLSLADYIKYVGTTEEALRNERRDAAKTAVHRQLVMEAIQKAEGIEATDEDVDAELQTLVTEGRTLEDMKSTLRPEDLEYFRGTVLNRKTIAVLTDNAKEIEE